ncbi:Fe2+-dependent dioxygenase [Gallaecimonas kandeliae]|uniref:Fe2+-dependent dioxygenase n=1 Tax=Gallaecimonas kandeliae TaxID=3029055 RepID=UPI0026471686|nr:Fe2+-dependent dioxygenase [Gallaecimonas kandeliae]WKE64122.1 Fe2+-dependent dioxygenase [Gallaecimonas kandeliae]
MLVAIEGVLTAEEVVHCRRLLDSETWIDGNQTSGPLAATQKRNLQLARDNAVANQLGQAIMDKLLADPRFVSAALPLKFYPPLFNRYEGGQAFGNHIDNAIRNTPDGLVRTDLSATLFLTEPEEYEGGELVVEDSYGSHSVKLPAGSLVLYPATSLHRVTPVTRGARVSAFMWLQSMVRDEGQRRLLYQLDNCIQRLAAAGSEEVTALTGVYHNLVRRWADS